MRGRRIIIIPVSMRMEMLEKLHTGHLGHLGKLRPESKSICFVARHRTTVTTILGKQHATNRAEPVIPTEVPKFPWHSESGNRHAGIQETTLSGGGGLFLQICRIGETNDHNLPRYHPTPEVYLSPSWDSSNCVVSDNVHSPFDGFASEYGSIHVTSSPRYAQGNGMAEQAVQIVESLLKLEISGFLLSIAHLQSNSIMPRWLRTTVPLTANQLKPSIADFNRVKQRTTWSKRSVLKRNMEHFTCHLWGAETQLA